MRTLRTRSAALAAAPTEPLLAQRLGIVYPVAAMNHRYTFEDVERAFQRYKAVTRDHGATLWQERNAKGYFIRLDGEWGMVWFGAPSACLALEAYCTGYGHGREDGIAEPA